MVMIQAVRVSLQHSSRGAHVSMTRVSYGNYRSVLLLLMVLNCTLATLQAPDTHSHSPPSTAAAATAPAASPSSSPPLELTRSATAQSAPGHLRDPENSAKPKATGLTLTDRATLGKLEKVFLNRAGLQRKPTIRPEFAVPDYMLELYQDHASNGYLQVKGKGPVPANTVRSFVHNDAESGRCVAPLCSRLHFDVASISDTELLTGSELRIFVNTGRNEKDSRGAPSDAEAGALVPSETSPLRNASMHRIEVHEILRPETSDSEAMTRLLDTRVVNLVSSGWESFDIQPAVLKWKKGVNHGLEVRLASRAPVLSTEHHVRTRRSAGLKDQEWALQRPILVTYTDDRLGPHPTPLASQRTKTRLTRRKRNASGGVKKPKDKKRKNGENGGNGGKRRRKKKKGNKKMCKRHSMYVSFEEVGWNDWIVAPPGYSAYFCSGECMAPLPDFAKATNHAMLQALVYKVNPKSVPMVCCVPTKMENLSMLYRDEQGRTILKHYQDMRVLECGCK